MVDEVGLSELFVQSDEAGLILFEFGFLVAPEKASTDGRARDVIPVVMPVAGRAGRRCLLLGGLLLHTFVSD